MLNTRVEKYNLRCSRYFGQNSPELNGKKNVLRRKKKFLRFYNV